MTDLWAPLLAVGAIALPLALAWWLAGAPERHARRGGPGRHSRRE